jgi:hypothetical protein
MFLCPPKHRGELIGKAQHARAMKHDERSAYDHGRQKEDD